MAAGSSTMRILSLYKQMLRESSKFTGYNYRLYAQRRIKDAFRENKNETDPTRIQSFLQKAEENLEIIKRQPSLWILKWHNKSRKLIGLEAISMKMIMSDILYALDVAISQIYKEPKLVIE